MASDETPIWEVIEEFKEKVKSQEYELKKRRDKLESTEGELEKVQNELQEQSAKLDARQRELEGRLAELVPRETAVHEAEAALRAQERDVRLREEEVQRSRVEIERRQAEMDRREEGLVALSESSAAYESDIRGMGERIKQMETSLLKDQDRARQLLEELTTARESLLAKGKVLADQEALLAEGRKIVLEEQKRFVGWEKALNEREESITRRSALPAQPAHEPIEAVEESSAPEPVEVEEGFEPEPKAVVHEIGTSPSPADEPVKEDEVPTPVFRTEEPKAEDDDEPTPVYRADEKPSRPTCPQCSSPISEDDEKCARCGHVLKDAPRSAEETERTEGKEDASKKPVSIRKIIRRK
jgi:hypothetical protein